jgi:predicted nucleotidyltransferase
MRLVATAAGHGIIALEAYGLGKAIMVQIAVDKAGLAEFCRRNHIRRLALFGSVLGEDFGPESDVDVLVEFDAEHVPGLLGVARMERELSSCFGGRKVDVRTAEDMSRYFRAKVLATAEVQFAG